MSSVVEHCPSLIAQRLRAEQTELAGRWLSRHRRFFRSKSRRSFQQIKYSDPKKADRFVEITAAMPLKNECVIEVRDNGLGIPSAKTRSICDQYVRAHAAQDGEWRNDGLGLGLTIVKDCIRTLGGQIDVQSSEGSGTVFIIRVPTE